MRDLRLRKSYQGGTGCSRGKRAWHAKNYEEKVIGEVCPVCRKAFGSRGQCLDHIEKQKYHMCLVNLALFYPDLDSEVVERADLQQKTLAAVALMQGEWHSWTGTRISTAWAFERFLIPTGHNRKSRFQFFQDYLKEASCV